MAVFHDMEMGWTGSGWMEPMPSSPPPPPPPPPPPSSSALVVSQVYGGGGNSGATLRQDFMEVLNRSSQPASLDGLSLQYASASGTTWQVTPLSGSLPPGGYFLVRQAQGAGGTQDTPAPDATGTVAMSATAGRVALVSGTTALVCASNTDCTDRSRILDLVGYGSATLFEGIAAAPGLSNTTANLRAGNGCTDTNENSTDFSGAAPAPRNSASPASVCP